MGSQTFVMDELAITNQLRIPEQIGQAPEHAHDACRVMAMITRRENESAHQVLEAVRPTTVFADVADTFRSYFLGDAAWLPPFEAENWRAEDFKLIQDTLATWFR